MQDHLLNKYNYMNIKKRKELLNLISECAVLDDLYKRNKFYKIAQSGSITSSLVDHVKGFFNAHIDSSKPKWEQFVNFMAPGAIALLFKGFGHTLIGILIGLAMSMFHIDISSILKQILSSLKSLTQDGTKQITSEQLKSTVDAAMASASSQNIQQVPESVLEDLLNKKSFNIRIRQNKLISLGYGRWGYGRWGYGYNEGIMSKLRRVVDGKLGSLLKIVLMVGAASAGLFVAGDVANHFIGRPSHIDDTIQHGKPKSEIPTSTVSTKQSFKQKTSYTPTLLNSPSNMWTESVPNNKQSIEDFVIDSAKRVYEGLDNKDNEIRNTSGFSRVVQEIANANLRNTSDNFIFIPLTFKNHKDMVDFFIDEVTPPQNKKANINVFASGEKESTPSVTTSPQLISNLKNLKLELSNLSDYLNFNRNFNLKVKELKCTYPVEDFDDFPEENKNFITIFKEINDQLNVLIVNSEKNKFDVGMYKKIRARLAIYLKYMSNDEANEIKSVFVNIQKIINV